MLTTTRARTKRRPADSHTCEILVHLNKHLVKGRGASVHYLAALVDVALVDKVEMQMRRLHERRVRRRNGVKGDRANGADAVDADESDGEGDVRHSRPPTARPTRPD